MDGSGEKHDASDDEEEVDISLNEILESLEASGDLSWVGLTLPRIGYDISHKCESRIRFISCCLEGKVSVLESDTTVFINRLRNGNAADEAPMLYRQTTSSHEIIELRVHRSSSIPQ